MSLARSPSHHEHGRSASGNYMNDQQYAHYLADLRSSRAERLRGSRPSPITTRYSPDSNARPIFSIPPPPEEQDALMPAPLRIPRSPSKPALKAESIHSPTKSIVSQGLVYHEEEARAKDRDEAQTLRMALEELDLEEEQRVFRAAHDEASTLISQHQVDGAGEPTQAFAIPDKSILRTARSQKPVELYGSEPQVTEAPAPVVRKKKSYQGLANAVAADIANIRRRVSSGGKRIVSGGRRKPSGEKAPFPGTEDKIYEEPETIQEEEPQGVQAQVPNIPPPADQSSELPRHIRKNPFARVRFNKDNLERANSIASTPPIRFNPIDVQKNPPSQNRKPWYTANKPLSVSEAPQLEIAGMNNGMEKEPVRVMAAKEIRSDDIRSATSMKRKDRSADLPQPTAVSNRADRPIVSFDNDWQRREEERSHERTPPLYQAAESRPSSRASTSAPKSFFGARQQTGPREPSTLRNVAAPASATNSTSQRPHSTPVPTGIPMLILPDDDDAGPSRVLSEEPDIPQLNILACKEPSPPERNEARSSVPHPRDLPVIVEPRSKEPPKRNSAPTPRPLPVPSPSGAARPNAAKPHAHPIAAQQPLTGQQRRAALCAQCALPISGRVLSAAGERFHPDCFACHRCGINLECVAFFPEPNQKYYERIARIQQRMQGFEPAALEGMTEEDMVRQQELDGDETMRFFCHLDYHELFSPRCKSCKTPIEGEVVMACGSEWHVGHFFCAQCGDPFDSKTPFVEKDGYAWCVGCHTHRYSSKCRKCKKPVTDLVVNALGHDWHGECFCCVQCGGGFDDGRYFLRGDSTDPVCTKCEDRRLKA